MGILYNSFVDVQKKKNRTKYLNSYFDLLSIVVNIHGIYRVPPGNEKKIIE